MVDPMELLEILGGLALTDDGRPNFWLLLIFAGVAALFLALLAWKLGLL